ncbi:Planctomycete cytochrome C [Singulisphaera sp. GP187]|uniref:PSD1 and planctomycete cytochrome C domain-containing protein n=1 Tax=Singulisphaera sp. GP187 TaxID=1882752 RepID=UPI0009260C6D|nr:PSD1 and planctomycete cytochrome C domain-containing protein [Singulisphaera sp. GP187]SIO57467.1 Planctomycete cytochrome C [Singulisphaera sp. GP187]
MWQNRFGSIAEVLLLVLLAKGASADGQEPVEFERDVAPILTNHCIRCHRSESKKGDVSLASATDLEDSGAVEPGKPAESTLIEVVGPSPKGGEPKMPREGSPLSSAQVAVLRRWVEQGAVWPRGLVLKEAPKVGAEWWSLRPLAKVPPPLGQDMPPGWPANPIDAFIVAGLKAKGLIPSPPADRRTLIRRVTYDLTGLPPSADEIASFEADSSPDAYEKLVDRLLASPRYGEQWGRHWLDVVRFGESRGYERNEIIPNAWPFRDYVIRSFNDDKPFDRLVREHLAGDVIGKDEPDVEVGTTFLVCGPYDDVGNQDAAQAALIRANTLDDLIRATGESFLGVTIGCARCHDHKFDPLSQKDYYGLYATFAGVRHGNRTVAAASARAAHEALVAPLRDREARAAAEAARLDAAGRAAASPDAIKRLAAAKAEHDAARAARTSIPPLPSWWVGTFEPAPGPFRIFLGGDPQRPGKAVAPAALGVLDAIVPGYQLPPDAPESGRRLALADWIVDPRNPLTPRVLANRLWHYHFGTGLVDTPSDFGFMGGRPSHPELLDWLASRLVDDGWRLKPLHRLIMTSMTYRQASTYRESAARVDGTSRSLWRFPPRRLAAEEVRDTMLMVAGLLDPQMGGPGFKLYAYFQDNVATYVPLDRPGPETHRRGVYHHSARASYLDVLSDFDCPDNAFGTPRRASTTTPLQALTMLNHGFSVETARAFADRLGREAGSAPADQCRRGFVLTFGRAPTDDEVAHGCRLIDQHGLPAFCRALLNASEMISID